MGEDGRTVDPPTVAGSSRDGGTGPQTGWHRRASPPRRAAFRHQALRYLRANGIRLQPARAHTPSVRPEVSKAPRTPSPFGLRYRRPTRTPIPFGLRYRRPGTPDIRRLSHRPHPPRLRSITRPILPHASTRHRRPLRRPAPAPVRPGLPHARQPRRCGRRAAGRLAALAPHRARDPALGRGLARDHRHPPVHRPAAGRQGGTRGLCRLVAARAAGGGGRAHARSRGRAGRRTFACVPVGAGTPRARGTCRLPAAPGVRPRLRRDRRPARQERGGLPADGEPRLAAGAAGAAPLRGGRGRAAPPAGEVRRRRAQRRARCHAGAAGRGGGACRRRRRQGAVLRQGAARRPPHRQSVLGARAAPARPVVYRIALINGEPGLLRYIEGTLESAQAIVSDGERIHAIYSVRNPDKLARIPALH